MRRIDGRTFSKNGPDSFCRVFQISGRLGLHWRGAVVVAGAQNVTVSAAAFLYDVQLFNLFFKLDLNFKTII